MKIDKNIFMENKYSKWYYDLIKSRLTLNRNNGEINKCVLQTDLNNYLNWNRGRI